ncbi:MAG: hypothetical protein WC314_14160 [Vulcanimicrobiota bacterium]
MDRGEQAQSADTGAAASHDALVGESASSDPDASREVAAAQAEVAGAVTGPVEGTAETEEAEQTREAEALTEEQQGRMDEYQTARATLDSAIAGEMVDFVALSEAREVVLGYADEVQGALGQMQQTFSTLDTQVARQTGFITNEGQMLSPEEQAAALEFTSAEVAKAQQPFDEATGALIATIQDPVVQSYLADLDPEQQKDFFESVSRYMPASEVGRAWSADFTDALAALGSGGQTANGLAEVAAEARAGLTPEDQVAFDATVGVLVGTGLAERPENADARLQSAAQALGLPRAELEALRDPASTPFEELGVFTQTATVAFSAFDSFRAADPSAGPSAFDYVSMGVGGLSKLAQMADESASVGQMLGAARSGLSRVSGALGVANNALGVIGLGFSVAATVDAIRQNNATDAISGGLGIAGTLGTMVAGAVGSGGLAVAGYALIGAGLALPTVVNGLQNEAFVEGALAAALGPEESSFSLRGRMIGTAPPSAAAVLDALRPSDMTVSQYLDSRIEGFNPEASDFAITIWGSILDEYYAQELP